MTAFATARSLLFVPGDRPERIAKALASGASAVIVDLEDAVAAPDKAAARQAVATWLSGPESAPILLRINDISTEWHSADLTLASHPNIAGTVLPKATATTLEALRRQTGKPLWPLIETAAGLADLPALAHLPGIARLLLGTIDLGLELGLAPDHPAGRAMLDHARYQLIAASAAAGLPAPVDGVFTDIADEPGLAAEAEASHARGMGAMMCIHPRQVAPVNAAMSPSEAEAAWARRVLAAAEAHKGAFSFEGRMIDKPVLDRARRILARL